MTTKEAKKLKPGDKVITHQMPPGETHRGEVDQKGYNGVTIHWDDDQFSLMTWDNPSWPDINRDTQ